MYYFSAHRVVRTLLVGIDFKHIEKREKKREEGSSNEANSNTLL